LGLSSGASQREATKTARRRSHSPRARSARPTGSSRSLGLPVSRAASCSLTPLSHRAEPPLPSLPHSRRLRERRQEQGRVTLGPLLVGPAGLRAQQPPLLVKARGGRRRGTTSRLSRSSAGQGRTRPSDADTTCRPPDAGEALVEAKPGMGKTRPGDRWGPRPPAAGNPDGTASADDTAASPELLSSEFPGRGAHVPPPPSRRLTSRA